MKQLVLICMLLICLSGCATDTLYHKDQLTFWQAVSDMWNHDYSKDPIDVRQRAEFYLSNYPDCTLNEKANLLIKDLNSSNVKYTSTTKEYTITLIYIYDEFNQQIWPYLNKKGRTSLDYFSNNMKQLGKSVEELDEKFD